MKSSCKSPDGKQLMWPVAAVAIGALAGMNPFFRPDIPFELGVAAWFVSGALVVILSLHSATLRVGILVAGLFMAVPCFVRDLPLSRGFLMCCAALSFAIVSAQLFAAPTAGFRDRMACVFTWLGTREVKRRSRSFDKGSLVRLIIATLVFAAAVAAVKAVPLAGPWWLLRWFAGGIMILAFAEMATVSHHFLTALMGLKAPALMESPHLSTSIGEFWTKRWNPAASALLFRRVFFAPLARRGVYLPLAAAFLASAVLHVMLAYMASGRWEISLMCGSFFLVQPLLIALERRMNVRRWLPAAGSAWTLTALTISSPLFVEPALHIIEPSWGMAMQETVLVATAVVLGFVIVVNLFFSLGSLASCPESGVVESSSDPSALLTARADAGAGSRSDD